MALFSSQNFSIFGIVALSFLFSNYCPIMDQLDSTYLSRDLQVNYAISFYFHLYLVLHACAVRFNVMKNLEKFLVFEMN